MAITPASAQVDKGSVLGTVADSSSAVIPGVTVRVTEVNTGIIRTSVTNETGNFSVPLLDPGTYRAEASREGFKTSVLQNVRVDVNSAVRVDFILELGAVAETVEIQAFASALQTDRVDVAQKIEAQTLQNLPLSANRNYAGTLALVPGATRPFIAHSAFYNSQESLSTQVNGQDRWSNNFLMEGINNNWDNGNLTILVPPVEAIQTVDVATSNYDAEFGRVAGAVTNVILRSGTNQYHGSLFWFNKVSALTSRNFFIDDVNPLVYNQGGGTIGGPIKRNKVFFFADYQGSRVRETGSQNYTIPSLAYRRGDLSTSPTRIYDPLTGSANGTGRVQFPGNIIPPNRISPIAAKLLSYLPDPSTSGLTANYQGAYTTQKTINSFDVKIDFQLTPQDSVAVRYSYQSPNITLPPLYDPIIGGPGGGPSGMGFAGVGRARTQFPGISWVKVFSPTLVSQFRFGIARIRNDAENSDFGTTTSRDFGIPGANVGDDWSSGLSQVNITGYDSPVFGYSASLPWRRAQTDFGFVNTWNKMAGSHAIKWGVDINRNRRDLLQTQAFNPRGRFVFTPGTTALNGDAASATGMGNAFAAFLMDLPNELGRDLYVQFPTQRNSWFFLFANDKWQVSRKLTLDLGMRWEIWPTTKPRFPGQQVDYDPDTNSLLVGGYGDIPSNLGVKPTNKAFAPRLGFAYRLSEQTVVRAGYGISYLFRNTGASNYPSQQAPVYNAVNAYSTAGSMATGFPAPNFVQIPDNGIIPNAPLNLNYTVVRKDVDQHHPYIQSWNFSLQRQLPAGFLVDVAYVGNAGIHIGESMNINQGEIPGAGAAGQPFFRRFGRTAAVNYLFLWANSMYNSLQVKGTRRFADGLSLTTAYTWGHGIDYNSNDSLEFNTPSQFRRNRATADFNRMHTFVQSFVFELPFGKGRRWANSGLASWLVGGWQTNGVFTAMTGLPLNITLSGTSLNMPGVRNKPDLIKTEVEIPEGINRGNPWFDTTAFGAPPPATFGNLGRNVLRGPGFVNLDASLFRRFSIREGMNFDLRFEAFNSTNTPHFANPGTTFGTATFGQVTTTVAGDNRSIQLGAKLTF